MKDLLRSPTSVVQTPSEDEDCEMQLKTPTGRYQASPEHRQHPSGSVVSIYFTQLNTAVFVSHNQPTNKNKSCEGAVSAGPNERQRKCVTAV